MSDDESSELNYDSEDSSLVVYSAEENDRYCVKRSLLVHSTKDLFDTLCLVRCRDHIPKRMLERFPGEIDGLRRASLVYMSGSPPEEAYHMKRSPRRWNWVQLRSNQIDLQAAFGRACAYYQDEIINNRISTEQQVDFVEHVEVLAVLYKEKGGASGLVANRWFALLLRTCARICLENYGMGNENRARILEEVADLAQRHWMIVQTL